jgi:hypothetical protein
MNPIAKELLIVLGRSVVKAGLKATDSVLNDIGEAVEEVDYRIKRSRERIKKMEDSPRAKR